MELVRFSALLVQLAIALALIGQLKSCTFQTLGLAAESSKTGMTSYSRFNQLLTSEGSENQWSPQTFAKIKRSWPTYRRRE